MNLAERAEATETVIRRFQNRAFDWRSGHTCIHLLRAQIRALGHKPPRIPAFRSARGALRALESTGQPSLEALVDTLLPRIPAAKLWVGDIVMLKGEPPLEAITIYAGFNKVWGWHGTDMSKLNPIAIDKADIIASWRA